MPGGYQLKTEVLANSACSLCGACLDWCPYLKNKEDHLVMTFDCYIQEGRCYAACPRTFTDWDAVRSKLLDGAPVDINVGPVMGVFKTKASRAIEMQQDGGTVTALVKTALGDKKVEAALLTGSKDSLSPAASLVTDLQEAEKKAGSRFLAAPTMRGLTEAASKGIKELAVVGRPCQIQALRKIQFNRPSDIPADGVIAIGLFCMWSLSWSLKGLIQEKMPGSKVLRLSIPQHGVEVETDQGKLTLATDEVRKYISRGCRYCTDMTSELADISVGSLEIEPGWNTVIVRTKRGMELLEAARDRGSLVVEEYPAQEFERLKGASFNKKARALGNLKEATANQGMTPFVDLSAEPYAEILARAEGEVSR